jgi:hypothetical protein
MKLQSKEDTIIMPSRAPQNNAVIDFVSELLAMTLAEQDEDMIIKAQSQDFLYDAGTGIKTTTSLKTVINCEDVAADNKIEITLSGTVTNLQGQKETFTLFFFTWLDKTANMSHSYNGGMNLRKKYLMIQFENSSKLFDSVFELNLYRKDSAGQQHSLGQGRGYLLFGNDPDNKRN